MTPSPSREPTETLGRQGCKHPVQHALNKTPTRCTQTEPTRPQGLDSGEPLHRHTSQHRAPQLCQHAWGLCRDTHQHTHRHTLAPHCGLLTHSGLPKAPRQTHPRAQDTLQSFTRQHIHVPKPAHTGNPSQARGPMHTCHATPGHWTMPAPSAVHPRGCMLDPRLSRARSYPTNAPASLRSYPHLYSHPYPHPYPDPPPPAALHPAHRAEPRAREIGCESVSGCGCKF